MATISNNALIELAIDLCRSLQAQDRFERLLRTVRQTIPCDAVVLLQKMDSRLKPLAQLGLTNDCMGRRFEIGSHPRFEHICQSPEPLRFDLDSPLPDPYDGMLLSQSGNLPVHACMGIPLRVEGELLGILTLDSMTPSAFEDIPHRTLDIVAAMSSATLNNAMLMAQLEALSTHNQEVVAELSNEALSKDGGELIGSSVACQKLRQEINLVAPSDFSVLVQGETGVGKELVARTIHHQSRRAGQALVYVNCAALPDNLVESELFGHVKGAFTGADRDRAGKFALADRGTIFLDEIGELPLSAQSKLLRVLQNQEIQRVGDDEVHYVDVRVIAATNRSLKNEIEQGNFRADLYHRLSVYPLNIPALREHPEDIPELVGFFAESLRRKLGLRQLLVAGSVYDYLMQYDWPGNVRELEHVVSRAALRATNGSANAIVEIGLSDLEHLVPQAQPDSLAYLKEASIDESESASTPLGNLKVATAAFQRRTILSALQACDGNWAAAARLLEMDRANLNRLGKRLGIRVQRTVQ